MVTPAALKGFMCALVTPVDGQGDVDAGGLERVVARVLAGRANGVCPVGSTGEGPRLTRAQRLTVVELVRKQVPGPVPVIPAPAAMTVSDALEEITAFADVGADACLLAPPAYFPMGDDEVVRYYEYVAGRSPLPILLYNIPALTKVRIGPGAAAELAAHPGVAGIKDSSRDLEGFQAFAYATQGEEFALLTGSDTLLMASLLVGGHGAIAASANLVPELGVGVYEASCEGHWEGAAAYQRRLFDVIQACRVGGLGIGWKAALELAGVCSGTPVPPATPLPADVRAKLAGRLEELGVLEDAHAR